MSGALRESDKQRDIEAQKDSSGRAALAPGYLPVRVYTPFLDSRWDRWRTSKDLSGCRDLSHGSSTPLQYIVYPNPV